MRERDGQQPNNGFGPCPMNIWNGAFKIRLTCFNIHRLTQSINSQTQYKCISCSFSSQRWVQLSDRGGCSCSVHPQRSLRSPDSFHVAALPSSRTVHLKVWSPCQQHRLLTRGLVRNALHRPFSGPPGSEMLGVETNKLCSNQLSRGFRGTHDFENPWSRTWFPSASSKSKKRAWMRHLKIQSLDPRVARIPPTSTASVRTSHMGTLSCKEGWA